MCATHVSDIIWTVCLYDTFGAHVVASHNPPISNIDIALAAQFA